jgi:hypothetical protein
MPAALGCSHEERLHFLPNLDFLVKMVGLLYGFLDVVDPVAFAATDHSCHYTIVHSAKRYLCVVVKPAPLFFGFYSVVKVVKISRPNDGGGDFCGRRGKEIREIQTSNPAGG